MGSRDDVFHKFIACPTSVYLRQRITFKKKKKERKKEKKKNAYPNLSSKLRAHLGFRLKASLLYFNKQIIASYCLQVCQGDTIEVLVDNRMELGEGTTIHWHGVTQKGTPYMDGTSMITQCPITKWSKMKYR